MAPTGGCRAAIGTNPIAIAVPAAGPGPFVLDMATSVVPRGRLEVAARRGERLPGAAARARQQGIELDPNVVTALTHLSARYGVQLPFATR